MAGCISGTLLNAPGCLGATGISCIVPGGGGMRTAETFIGGTVGTIINTVIVGTILYYTVSGFKTWVDDNIIR